MKLREHDVRLRGERVILRPLTEEDWDILLRWNSDPEILTFADGEDVQSYGLEQVQRIYRPVSQRAFYFSVELGGVPIGECWLQQINLERILQRYPDADCRRIDLLIGEKELWGKGWARRSLSF